MTEASLMVTLDYDSLTVDSAGPLLADTEVKFIDLETGKSLGCNETGEVCVRGPKVMKGFRNNAASTKEMIDAGGWLHTSDIGYIRDNECIMITDRLKELIQYKGQQYSPT
ncbi:uncharacterized protein LOC128549911 [Mercenaria mercenaria]|uniref:uncharacterized protein LOC128549911 n=1 Tax=Mercenaria mercenaria TaxID=6596 RepID=UPI00234E45C8|nr:uncharacterized protein LOC128549911 [Mercenaria mercenaria]